MKNLLLISLDCLRADVAYSGRISAVNRLIKQSTYFTNAISRSSKTMSECKNIKNTNLKNGTLN